MSTQSYRMLFQVDLLKSFLNTLLVLIASSYLSETLYSLNQTAVHFALPQNFVYVCISLF